MDKFISSFTWLDFWGNLGFLLIGVSMLAKDILLLRVLSSVASATSVVYNYAAFDAPAWIVIWWNLAFLLINVFNIMLLLKEKASVQFTPEEQELYATVFRAFSKVEFMKLLKAGSWVYEPEGITFTKEGSVVKNVILIYNGIASVTIGGQEVTELKDGAIIGEMSFLTGNPATATVIAKTKMKVISWEQDKLRQLIARNPSMKTSLQTVFSLELTKKLQKN